MTGKMHTQIEEMIRHRLGRRELAVQRLLGFGVPIETMVFVESVLPEWWMPDDGFALAPTQFVLEVSGRPVWRMVTVYERWLIRISEEWLDPAFAGDVPGPVVLA